MFWKKSRPDAGASVPSVSGTRTPAAAAGTRSPDPTLAAKTPALSQGGRGRLIFGLDATASRQPTWEIARQIQASMFDAAARSGGLIAKLVFYRGISTCRASAWTSDSHQLRRWMNGVSCEGGNTQIERILAHAIVEAQKQRVNALVFVGDAMEEDGDRLCQLAAQLGVLRVPIFVFQEGSDEVAAEMFKQIAALSKGAYFKFDRSSVDRLRDLLRAIAVFASGGSAALLEHARKNGNQEIMRLTHQLSGQ